ncbi:MAG: response regulator [Armatimonadetes bacterium]|nr:response regulator [Armatimonadota bacterium]
MNAGTHRTILLVEDNPDDVELTLLAFEEGNLTNEIIVARDGEEALDYLFGTGPYADQTKELPAVILLDLKLPKISGLDVLKQVRSDPRTNCLPVVVLTSSKEDEDIMRSYSLGANAYVRKPVDYAEFVKAAQTLGLFWLLLNEAPPRRRSCTT